MTDEPTNVAVPHSPFRTDDVLRKIIEGFEIQMPVSKKFSWTRSRMIVSADGLVPILHLAARERFPDWNSDTHEPYWLDRDWMNESVANVGLTEVRQSAAKRRSKYGHPAGSKEYQKAYRQENADKLRIYHRLRARKVRAEVSAYKHAVERATSVPTGPEADVVKKGDALLSLLGNLKDTSK